MAIKTVFCPPSPEPHVFFDISGCPANETAPDLAFRDSAPGSDKVAVILCGRWTSLRFHFSTATLISMFWLQTSN